MSAGSIRWSSMLTMIKSSVRTGQPPCEMRDGSGERMGRHDVAVELHGVLPADLALVFDREAGQVLLQHRLRVGPGGIGVGVVGLDDDVVDADDVGRLEPGG